MATLLLGAFTVSLAYGIALPILPFLLERRMGAGPGVASHTGLLTGTYTLALFLFAPLWGRLSDRCRRRPVILAGMAGFAASLVLFAFIDSLIALYIGRFLTGAFSAAVLPVSLAMVSDWAPNEDWRARRFSWLAISGVGGFLLGPAIGGAMAQMWSSGMPPSGAPFLGVAMIAVAATVAAWMALPREAPCVAASGTEHSAPRLVTPLLVLGSILAVALGAFEVGLALRAQQMLGLTPAQIGLMFTECMAVMVAAQALVFNPWFPARATRWVIAPAFVALAGALVLLPRAASGAPLLLAVALIAGAAGILSPILSFWVSLAAGKSQGSMLGRQAAASSLGQAVGSALGGLLFGWIVEGPQAAFILTGLAVLAAGGWSLGLPGRLSALAPAPAARRPEATPRGGKCNGGH